MQSIATATAQLNEIPLSICLGPLFIEIATKLIYKQFQFSLYNAILF